MVAVASETSSVRGRPTAQAGRASRPGDDHRLEGRTLLRWGSPHPHGGRSALVLADNRVDAPPSCCRCRGVSSARPACVGATSAEPQRRPVLGALDPGGGSGQAARCSDHHVDHDRVVADGRRSRPARRPRHRPRQRPRGVVRAAPTALSTYLSTLAAKRRARLMVSGGRASLTVDFATETAFAVAARRGDLMAATVR